MQYYLYILMINMLIILNKQACGREIYDDEYYSFPSGHSGINRLSLLCTTIRFCFSNCFELFSVFNCKFFLIYSLINFIKSTFIQYYVQKRCKFPYVFRSMVQFPLCLLAFFICMSRVRDSKHRLKELIF